MCVVFYIQFLRCYRAYLCPPSNDRAGSIPKMTRKKALLIGINYTGTENALNGCHNDVNNVRDFLVNDRGFSDDSKDMVIMTDTPDNEGTPFWPSGENILAAFKWLTSYNQDGDIVWLSYSGHGGQVKDTDDNRPTGFDDTICPVDFTEHGQMSSEILHRKIVSPMNPRARLTILFDCCHSGSACELPFVFRPDAEGNVNLLDHIKKGMGLVHAAGQLMRGGFSRDKIADAKMLLGGATDFFNGLHHARNGGADDEGLAPEQFDEDWEEEGKDVWMFSGCRDDQTSADATISGAATGAMSWAFIGTMREDPDLTYRQILQATRAKLVDNYEQIPQLSCGGHYDLDEPLRVNRTMDRNQPAAAASLLDQEGKIIAEILRSYRDLVNFATEPITNKTSTGQASYNSMAMDLETQNLIKSVENLLSLTRRIRELWIVGPLRKPGEGDRTEETINSEVKKVVGILNQLRSNKRQQLVSEGGGYGQFEVGDLAQPTQPSLPGAPGSTSAPTNGAAPHTAHGDARELSMLLDGEGITDAESAGTGLARILVRFLRLWASTHRYLAPPETTSALLKTLANSMASWETRDETLRKGYEFVMSAPGIPPERPGITEAAPITNETIEKGNTALMFPQDEFVSFDPARQAEDEDEDKEDDGFGPLSPIGTPDWKFVQEITQPSPEGKSLMQDFMDTMTSPTHPPENVSAAMEDLAQDLSADQQTSDPKPANSTDESSESRSSLTSPSSFEDEVATGCSSVGVSPRDDSKDESSSVEHTGESPQPTD
ncbi:hypothetical protein N8I77_007040 [Diaporthe amygdali]|uniref:Peptidase C14 caspase domain-containing protein n=1 Tax=Phomopsis amygdali TaxID=1214568 RepID=A0AAD9SAW5_PHOAM|nr:hypothetical protein N8I77_007040 [Diaporthe amygdali]